jgi:hypothetical protein
MWLISSVRPRFMLAMYIFAEAQWFDLDQRDIDEIDIG